MISNLKSAKPHMSLAAENQSKLENPMF